MRSKGLFLAAMFGLFLSAAAWAQSKPEPAASNSTASNLRNGVEIENASLHEEITALRDDVLRIRVWRGETPPEDASWAVLQETRHASVPVISDEIAGRAGFRTGALAVAIDRQTLEITIRNSAGEILQQDARAIRYDGDAFRVYKVMPLDEHYFGLGDKTGPLDRRNGAFTLWNTDAYRFQESTDPLYKSIPYFMAYRAGRAIGVLLDNTWRSSFDFGKESPAEYSFGAAAGPVDYYFFYGPDPKHVVETYAWLTGKPPLPPLWSLGFQQSRYSYTPQSRVLEIADRLRADRIPSDAIYLDIDYQSGNRPFTIDRSAFPNFSGMIAQLKAENFHLVLITDLHIADCPEPSYLPYDTGVAGDNFVKNPDGSIYTGVVWPGRSNFPDFTRQKTREWWGTLYRDFVHSGADGFWNDMNEPSIFNTPTFTMPLNVVHRIEEPGFAPRDATHAEIHNVYGMENSRATYEGLLALNPDSRPFVLTRATYAGGQRYAATWTGDNSSSWNHLRMTTPMLENLGLSGFAFSGADVGGFAGTPSPELLTRWIEVGAFQPIDRDHTEKGTGDQEPWVGGAEQENIRRHFIQTRYRLMPYIYTLADEASRTGLPLMRPLFLEFPDATADLHPMDLDSGAGAEFLLGPDLLIAPQPYPDELDDYQVELPTSGWYDFWTGERVQSHALPQPVTVALDPDPPKHSRQPLAINVTPRLDRLPVYVRAGAILPMAPLVESTNEMPHGPLTLRIYTGDPCTGSLYQDDGKSFAFERGDFLRMNFTCAVTSDGLEIAVSKHDGAFIPWWTSLRLEIYGWTLSRGIIHQDGRNSTIPIEHEKSFFTISIPDSGTGTSLKLK
ncbi:MAG: TIM-barrel domain-containing protein [Terracidiphilus sp.]